MSFAALESLPPPVARCLRHVLREGEPIPRQTELRQRGELRTGTRSSRWLPSVAERCGMRVPSRGEAGRYVNGGWGAGWKGEVVAVRLY